ncbi:MAG: hypothetical protein Q4E02_02615 [Lagierella massiliensis]|nr:hypothetical protein [Lagierella massiliensis]
MFNIAWEGFTDNSYMYEELSVAMEPLFHEAIKNINQLRSREVRQEMIVLYIVLMFNISDNPIKDYIPNIFSINVLEETIKMFYFELKRQVELLDIKGKKQIFDKWILQFLENRIKSYQTPITDYEKNLILNLLLIYPDDVEDLNLIFDELDKKFEIDNTIIEYIYIMEISSYNANIICKVLVTVTNHIKKNTKNLIPEYLKNELLEIYRKLVEINVKIKELEKNLKSINVFD